MNKKLAITISLLVVLCFSLAGSALAQTVVPGVKAGDFFAYSITTHWSTTNSSLSPPVYLVYSNQTKWYNVSVSDVSGTNVTATNIWEYYNGSQNFARVDLEVENGTLNLATGETAFTGFYPANLNTNDLLRPLAPEGPRINETITRDYASGKRDTNVFNYSYQVYLVTDLDNSTIGNETLTYYIDKETGVLVESFVYTEFPDQIGSIQWKLVATNVWLVSPRPLSLFEITAIVAIAVVISIVVILYIRSRRRHRH